jgi:hypothetical protein
MEKDGKDERTLEMLIVEICLRRNNGLGLAKITPFRVNRKRDRLLFPKNILGWPGSLARQELSGGKKSPEKKTAPGHLVARKKRRTGLGVAMILK